MVLNIGFEISDIQKKSRLRFGIYDDSMNSVNTLSWLKTPVTQNNFLTLNITKP